MKSRDLIAGEYVALYLPSTGCDKNPTKGGFVTEDEAYEYVKSFYCEPGCIPCACEWVVVKEKDIQDSKTFTDILIAAGFELG